MIKMGLFDEDINCVKSLLKPSERVLNQELDVYVESYQKRTKLWLQIEENYDRYLDGECGKILSDLDQHIRSKFEVSLALLAWSFKKNDEFYEPASRRYSDKELEALGRVLRYNVFEIYTIEDVMKRIMHRDNNILTLLREYHHGVDRWIEEVLNDPEIKLPLRYFLKKKWDSYKEKVNEAIAEATRRFDWFRDFLTMVDEEIEVVETTYRRRLDAKDRQIEELRRSFERELKEIKKELDKGSEVEKLLREKEELKRQFEEEKKRILEDIGRMRDEEMKKMLKAELEKVKEDVLASVKAIEDEIRQKEDDIKRREEEVAKKIREVTSLAGKVEKGSRFVRCDEARIMELNFIGRIKSKFMGDVKLLGRTFRVERVEENVTFDKMLLNLDERNLKNIPDNTVVNVVLKEKKLFGKGKEIKVKAVFLSRPERYAEIGFDTDPIELTDINSLLVDARNESERIVLLVASPTGFEERIANYVNSNEFHKNYLSDVSLALLDLESGELIYNPHDKYAKAFEPILRLEIDSEIISKVKEYIESKIAKGYVKFEEVTEQFPGEVVKRAFHELAKEKKYTTKFIEGVGYILVK